MTQPSKRSRRPPKKSWLRRFAFSPNPKTKPPDRGSIHGIFYAKFSPDHVRGADHLSADGLPRGLQPRCLRPVFWLYWRRAWLTPRGIAAGPAAAPVRHHAERHAAGHPLLHLDGLDT